MGWGEKGSVAAKFTSASTRQRLRLLAQALHTDAAGFTAIGRAARFYDQVHFVPSLLLRKNGRNVRPIQRPQGEHRARMRASGGGTWRTTYAQEAFSAPRIRAGFNCCCNPLFGQRALLQKAARTFSFSLDNPSHDKSVCTSDMKIPCLPQQGQS